MVKLHGRHLHTQGLLDAVAPRRRRLRRRLRELITQRQLPGTLGDHLGIEAIEAPATLDGLLHTRLRMFEQQLQDAHIMASARLRTVPRLQTFTQLLEHGRQLPLAIDIGMIQGSRPTLQRGQVMQRLEHLTAWLVTALMPGYHLAGDDDFDALDVGLHGCRLKGVTPRHAVTHLIETRGLVLVDLRGLKDAGVETHGRQWQRPLPIPFVANADGLLVLARGACPVLQATLPQVGVEFGQVLHAWHRRRPTALQSLDPILHVRLLVASRRHAKQRLEHVVAGQRLVTCIHLPVAAAQDRRRHRLGIVPPHFTRDILEELEALHHPFQDRFGPLARHSHGERAVRVRPHQHQHGDLPTPVGEVDVDVTEIGFQTLTRIVRQRNERLGAAPLYLTHEATHGIAATIVTVLVTQAFEDPLAGVPLLRRRQLIVAENLLDDVMKPAQLGRRRLARTRKRLRLGLRQCFADFTPRMVKSAGDGTNAHAIAVGPAHT